MKLLNITAFIWLLINGSIDFETVGLGVLNYTVWLASIYLFFSISFIAYRRYRKNAVRNKVVNKIETIPLNTKDYILSRGL
jgi:multisubunit Na+/H+ antiporter MnhE subunit